MEDEELRFVRYPDSSAFIVTVRGALGRIIRETSLHYTVYIPHSFNKEYLIFKATAKEDKIEFLPYSEEVYQEWLLLLMKG